MKLDLADSNAWIVKASYWSCVWAKHNSFFKCKISLFAFKVFLNVAYFSLVATSKACCNVPIVCTYVLETHKWFSRPCRKDYHGRDFNCNLVPIKQGCERSIPKMKPFSILGREPCMGPTRIEIWWNVHFRYVIN